MVRADDIDARVASGRAAGLIVLCAFVAAIASSGCQSVALRDGVFACIDDTECPPGFACRATERRCFRAADGPRDASPGDGANGPERTDAALDSADGGDPMDVLGADAVDGATSDADVAPDPNTDAPITCTVSLACAISGGRAGTAPCTPASVGGCAPTGFQYCDCPPAASTDGWLFLDPPSSSGGRLRYVIVVARLDAGTITMSIDGVCFGATAVSCPWTGACAGSTGVTRLSVWTVGPSIGGHDLTTAGEHVVRVFYNDDGPPCDSAPVLVNTRFVIP